MKKTLLTMLSGLAISPMMAQLYVTDTKLDLTGVTNEGIAVGSPDQNQPYYLWNALTGEYTEIGGNSAGNGIGGVARFSADGKRVIGSMASDQIQVSNQWMRSLYNDFDYTYTDMAYVSDYMLYAVGKSEDGQTGVILKSSNNGATWRDGADISVKLEGGLECVAALGYSGILTGGQNGKLYYSTRSYTWNEVDIHPADDNTAVKTYWAMDFMPDEKGTYATYGAVGFETEDGGYGVWYTEDGAENFYTATGVSGIPSEIIHVGDTFYMTTKNGHIQMSTDGGATWEDIFTLEGGTFYNIRFADDQRGIALTDQVVYITTDGGATWTKTTVLPSISIGPLAASTTSWLDATWTDDVITVVGNNGSVFRSKDGGANFDKINLDFEYYANNYACIFYDRNIYNILADHGRFYRKSDVSTLNGYCAGVYDVENKSWKALTSFGYDDKNVTSSPWNISGDGQTVVGLAYNFYSPKNSIQAHATMWNDAYGITDLGSLFADLNRASRANAVSYDGSVIAGWQDAWGPWFGTVWRKQSGNTYTQTLLFKDKDKTMDDLDINDRDAAEGMLLGFAQAVSADGKWIGGNGYETSAVPGPWLWSEETGAIQLTDQPGSVSAINNDGTKAVGWLGTGQKAWLWTSESGFKDLNDYVKENLGWKMDDFVICSVYAMSPNGRYVAGYGLEYDEVRGYVLDLETVNTGIAEKAASQIQAAVYPNPVATELHVDLPYSSSDLPTSITLCDAQGRTVKQLTRCAQSNVISVAGMVPGVYVLNVQAAGQHKTFKILVKR
ncbi:MAG: T9SS type A sorting domain-containing protein [Alloprevotella sp.]